MSLWKKWFISLVSTASSGCYWRSFTGTATPDRAMVLVTTVNCGAIHIRICDLSIISCVTHITSLQGPLGYRCSKM